MDEEALLIARAKDGSDSAFETLYNENKNAIHDFVRWKLQPWGLGSHSEDVTQDAFIRAWEAISSFRGSCSFYGWVRTIAWRMCIHCLREHGRELPTGDAELLEAVLNEAACCNVHEVIIFEEEKERVKCAIDRLSHNERQVIVKFLEGFSDSEVARALEKTVHQVNGLKRRAVEKLKRLLPNQLINEAYENVI